MADKKKMSIEEILAAARKTDAAGGGSPAPASKPAASPTPEVSDDSSAPAAAAAAEPSTPSPAAAPPAKAASKPGSAMSVADVLAAARANKAAAAAPPAAAAKPAAAKAEAKPAAKAEAKPAAAKPAAAKPAASPTPPADTASILAAARGGAKPGPISKTELAARGAKDAPVATGKVKPVVPPIPDKPAYARPGAPVPVAASPGRRGFLQTMGAGVLAASAGSALALGFSSLAVTFNLWVLGFARFMFPNILTEPPTKFKVGFPNELAQGQVQTKFVPQFGVWIVRHEYDGAPQIYALQTVCTHLGCTPNWLEGEQKFKCPCHGSGFYKDGVNFEGPAPRPLERFAVRLADDGQLEVDKSRKFKEELGQWRDAASYVPV